LLENLKDLKNHYENIHDIEETSLTTTVENAEQILTKLENKLALKVKNPQFESKMNQISQLQCVSSAKIQELKDLIRAIEDHEGFIAVFDYEAELSNIIQKSDFILDHPITK